MYVLLFGFLNLLFCLCYINFSQFRCTSVFLYYWYYSSFYFILYWLVFIFPCGFCKLFCRFHKLRSRNLQIDKSIHYVLPRNHCSLHYLLTQRKTNNPLSEHLHLLCGVLFHTISQFIQEIKQAGIRVFSLPMEPHILYDFYFIFISIVFIKVLPIGCIRRHASLMTTDLSPQLMWFNLCKHKLAIEFWPT